ncbi:rifin PIR protein, putative [Plasmodium sp. DRC-Itaito]|nr:rifin PIR protein, putative [Plasmodium sp. DRC-Itaito]
MKLHYLKILLFFILLNILVTLYQEHNNNEPHSTPHHTQTNRSLCECETQSSIYNKDEEMKSVMQQFVDRTSQRLREYDERIQDKRQKRKEERDKNIKKIIEKDKREKSLEQKIEKGCLRCGCGLGGVAASVGVFGGLGVYGSEMAATAVAGKAAGIKEGIKVGLERVIAIAEQLIDSSGGEIPTVEILQPLTTSISGDNITFQGIFECIKSNIKEQLDANVYKNFILAVDKIAEKQLSDFNAMTEVPAKAVTDAIIQGKADAIAAAHAEYAHLYSAIGYSVLAILIIVLVMIIIYLILRYRRKKKMKKKDQYEKLLEE